MHNCFFCTFGICLQLWYFFTALLHDCISWALLLLARSCENALLYGLFARYSNYRNGDSVAFLLSYTSTKHYQDRSELEKVIAETKGCTFFGHLVIVSCSHHITEQVRLTERDRRQKEGKYTSLRTSFQVSQPLGTELPS